MINNLKQLLHVVAVGMIEAPAVESQVSDPKQHFACPYRHFPRLERNGSHAVTIGFDTSERGFEISFNADTLHADNLASLGGEFSGAHRQAKQVWHSNLSRSG
ncbi:MAG TPA: hypothetical protein VGZ26_12870 [Pirellulales bacterium]|jgi:hypothetical protein|nr:hypothetical protein [Pirellulales bacterium]